MPDNMSKERINLLKAYGAEVVLTPAEQRMPGAIAKALELQNKYRIVLSRNNLKIQLIRIFTVIRLLEIYEQMDGELDAFVATAGTGGTITGTGETLKEKLPNLYIAVVEPKGSPVLSGGVPGPHKLVGTSPGFIPKT